MDNNKWPPIDPGTKVRTTQPNLEKRQGWSDEGWASKKWDVRGTVLTHHDFHGLCYDVRHEDDTVGCYDPSELEVDAKGVDLDELQSEADKLVSLLKDRQPGLATWNRLLRERVESLHWLTGQVIGK